MGLLCIVLAACAPVHKDGVPPSPLKKTPTVSLIPRDVLFGNPLKAGVRISPDGRMLSYIAPSARGVLNVWVKTIGKDDDRMITDDRTRGIRSYQWAYNGKQIGYIQDKLGDENWHLYVTDLATRETRDLTPFTGVRVQDVITDRHFSDEVYVALNRRDPQVFDLYRLNLVTGALALDTENPGDVGGWVTDHNFVVRVAVATDRQDGGTIIRVRDGKGSPWRELLRLPFGESGGVVGFAEGNRNLYMTTSVGSDTTRLVEVDSKTGAELRTLIRNEKADIGRILQNPDTYGIEAVSFNYLMPEWSVLDDAVKEDFALLRQIENGVFSITGRDLENKKWTVAFISDTGPVSFYLYDRERRHARFLFVHRPDLGQYTLAAMRPFIIKARDGLELVSYLTLPPGTEAKAVPLVLLVHGGPWARDGWGLDNEVQWLANRGYGVLQVNFRGSTGFGKAFLNAGNGQWGVGAMQHDLTDAVQWAIGAGIADPAQIAIMGASYGGYATLAGLTFTPDLYSCGVDIVGPSNLRTLMESVPPYWVPFKRRMILRIGDVERDDAFNRKISPLFHVENIRVPLMIAQGANDPRVKIAEAEQVVTAMRAKGLPVTYIVYPDEGHGFARPENRLDFYGRVEEFLARCLGGRAEPWQAVDGATAQVR